MPDVLIAGGGIVGTACARALALRGVSTLVLDASEPGAATPASAGILGPLADAETDDPILELYVRGRDLYGELAPRLKEETGTDIGLWHEGIFQIAFSADDVDRGKKAVAYLRQQGLHMDWLEEDDLRQRCPGIAGEARGAGHRAADSAVDPGATLQALRLSAEGHGAEFAHGERALEVLHDGGRVTGIRTARGDRTAGSVLVAAGAWSGRIAGLPRPLSVEPVRGQIAVADWPQGEPGAVVYSGIGYVVHRAGQALGGTTMEFAGFAANPTDAGLAGIRNTMTRFYPALENAPVVRSWAGLRPWTPDGRPIIGVDPDVPNLWYATGHGRWGILLGALTGELMARLIAGEPVGHDLRAVRPERFWVTEH
jgi:glycine oxidase